MNPIPSRLPRLKVGSLPSGPRGLLTDVPGVSVGHYTLVDSRHNTGLSVIVPAGGNLFREPLVAAAHVINGFGKTTGIVQIGELGTLETPIVLTSTLQACKVADALIGHMLDVCARDGIDCFSVNPVVGETNTSILSDDRDRPLGAAELERAFAAASPDFEEGIVGAGRGTICYGLKGGIGSASRLVDGRDGRAYTVGVLVQTNFGVLEDLLLDGRPVGRRVAEILRRETGARAAGCDRGSIMIVVGTDLPADHLTLGRILRRAAVGLVRTGSHVGHGSGDVVLGFTTANRRRADGDAPWDGRIIRTEVMETAFRAVAEAVEEAIYRSLLAAEPVSGRGGASARALCEFLPELERDGLI